jgi:hypothetical protein
VVDEVGSGVLGAAGRTRGADAAALAGKRHQQLMPAGAATDPSETPGEDAAADEAVELALHQLRHGLSSTCGGGRERRTMMPDRPMQWFALDIARTVARRQRRAGLGAAQKPAVAAR